MRLHVVCDCGQLIVYHNVKSTSVKCPQCRSVVSTASVSVDVDEVKHRAKNSASPSLNPSKRRDPAPPVLVPPKITNSGPDQSTNSSIPVQHKSTQHRPKFRSRQRKSTSKKPMNAWQMYWLVRGAMLTLLYVVCLPLLVIYLITNWNPPERNTLFVYTGVPRKVETTGDGPVKFAEKSTIFSIDGHRFCFHNRNLTEQIYRHVQNTITSGEVLTVGGEKDRNMAAAEDQVWFIEKDGTDVFSYEQAREAHWYEIRWMTIFGSVVFVVIFVIGPTAYFVAAWKRH